MISPNSCKFVLSSKILIVFSAVFPRLMWEHTLLYSVLIISAGLVAAALLTCRNIESCTIPQVIRKTSRKQPYRQCGVIGVRFEPTAHY